MLLKLRARDPLKLEVDVQLPERESQIILRTGGALVKFLHCCIIGRELAKFTVEIDQRILQIEAGVLHPEKLPTTFQAVDRLVPIGDFDHRAAIFAGFRHKANSG